MAKEKNPYVSYSLEDIQRIESNFAIQLNDDLFYTEDGRYSFKMDKAEYFFNELKHGLSEIVKSDTEDDDQLEHAWTCLLNLRIFPIRIH